MRLNRFIKLFGGDFLTVSWEKIMKLIQETWMEKGSSHSAALQVKEITYKHNAMLRNYVL